MKNSALKNIEQYPEGYKEYRNQRNRKRRVSQGRLSIREFLGLPSLEEKTKALLESKAEVTAENPGHETKT